MTDHDPLIEQAILGAIMVSGGRALDDLDDFDPASYYRPQHEELHRAFLGMAKRGEPIDTASTGLACAAIRGLSADYFVDLSRACTSSASAGFHAGTVSRFATLRRAREAGQRLSGLDPSLASSADNLDAALDAAKADLDRLGVARSSGITTFADVADRAIDSIGNQVYTPTPWADLNHLIRGWSPAQMYGIGARPGVGKALALDTPLPTPSGWTTMGAVMPGEYLIGADGKPTRVVMATEVQLDRDCYEVEFSDGTVIVADAEHQWVTETRAARRATTPPAGYIFDRSSPFSRDQRWKSEKPIAVTTAEIARSLRVGSDDRPNHSVAIAKAFDLEDQDLAIPPYVLGVWLGDGHSYSGTYFSADPEIPMNMEIEGQPTHKLSSPYAYGAPGLKVKLREIGVLENKHIPDIYLRGSEQQRRDLLAGLLDTDGWANKRGGVQFCVTNERLARGAWELVLSLGYQASMNTKRVKGRSEESSTAYMINFTPIDKVFRLTRKAARQVVRTRALRRYIVDVRPIPSVPVRCLQVDNADHLYLASRSCIPTHNTVFAVQAAIHAAQSGLGVAYYTFEMSGERLYLRALASIAKVDIGKLLTGNLSEAEWRAISRADHDVLRNLPVVVEGSAGWSAQKVVSHAKAAHRKHPLGLIFIDHIGRVAPGEGRRDNRQQEVADSANYFLDMAHQLDSAVVICTQLNREVTKRADARPVATDIRESDVIEQNLDVLMLLHRDKEKTPRAMDILVAKNRDGIEAPVHMTFEGEYSRVTDREWTPNSAIQSPPNLRSA